MKGQGFENIVCCELASVAGGTEYDQVILSLVRHFENLKFPTLPYWPERVSRERRLLSQSSEKCIKEIFFVVLEHSHADGR
jgi:hypothetical protein